MKTQTSSLEIKIATSDYDFDQAAKIINIAFKQQIISIKNQETITASEIKKIPTNYTRETLLLYKEDAPIGTLMLNISLNISSIIISHLSIAPHYKGQKLGLDLMNAAEKRISGHYFYKLAELNVIHHPKEPQDGLSKYYLQQGYEYTHSTKPTELELRRYFLTEYHEELTLKWFRKILL